MATNFAIGYKGIKDWTIKDIESLNEYDAFAICDDCEIIKEHSIYFVDFGGYFGFSALVFMNGHHVKYANDYELHHSTHAGDREWLRKWYVDTLNNKLFTEKEIAEPLKDYNDYDKKCYFLHNYYNMRVDYVSMFFIGNDEDRPKTDGLTFDPVGFCYVQSPEFVKRHCELLEILNERKAEVADNFEYQKNAFLHEMYNHEYGINWQADYDTLSAFGRVNWHDTDIKAYFEELNFTDTQKRAYFAAREQYFAETREMY